MALVIQMILSMLSQYARKDFIVITGCVIGFYFMEYPENVRRQSFRQLVALFAISLFYDIVWLIVNRDLEEDDSGGVEQNIKRFSTNVSYISFAFRVSIIALIDPFDLLQIIVMLILHKASLDFLTIVKGKNTNDKAGLTLED